jgi:hypothetical protein
MLSLALGGAALLHATAAAQGAPLELPLTWISAGSSAGEALLLGTPLSSALPKAGLSATLTAGSRTLGLPVLQQGNGTIMLGLPERFTLAPWDLHLCTGAGSCTAPVPIFSHDLKWHGCDGVACAPGGLLRLFGRRLAFDSDSCRPFNSTQPIAGREAVLRLTPLAAAAASASPSGGDPVTLKATQQSCFEAAFPFPPGLPVGRYTVELATSVIAGQLGPFTPPGDPNLQILDLTKPTVLGSAILKPTNKTGAAIMAALSEAASHAGGAVVQLAAGKYELAANDMLVPTPRLCARPHLPLFAQC